MHEVEDRSIVISEEQWKQNIGKKYTKPNKTLVWKERIHELHGAGKHTG